MSADTKRCSSLDKSDAPAADWSIAQRWASIDQSERYASTHSTQRRPATVRGAKRAQGLSHGCTQVVRARETQRRNPRAFESNVHASPATPRQSYKQPPRPQTPPANGPRMRRASCMSRVMTARSVRIDRRPRTRHALGVDSAAACVRASSVTSVQIAVLEAAEHQRQRRERRRTGGRETPRSPPAARAGRTTASGRSVAGRHRPRTSTSWRSRGRAGRRAACAGAALFAISAVAGCSDVPVDF